MYNRNLWTQAKKQLSPLTAAIGFGVILGGLIVAQAWVISRVIASIFLEQKALTDVQDLLLWLIVIVIARSGAVYWRSFFAGRVSIRVRAALQKSLVEQILRLSPVQVSSERTGEITNTVVLGIAKLDDYFRVYLPQLALSVILPLVILTVAFPVDWLTGVIFLVTAPLIPLFMLLIGKEAEKKTERQWKLLGRLGGHFYEVLSGLRILKAYGLSKRQSKVIQLVSDQYASVTLKVLRIAFLSALALEILATISTAVIAVQIGLRLLYGQISFFNSLFILILAPEFYYPLRQLGAAFHSGMEGISASERIFEILNEKTIQRTTPGKPKKQYDLQGDIRFEGVSYAYQGGERPSLAEVSFSIPWKKKTVLVGPSGAGKSTILALLMGFIFPDEGCIIINGIPLDEIPIGYWRRHLTWLPQFPALFNQSVSDNLRISRPNAIEPQLELAAKKANAFNFISKLSNGFDTNIGEGGTKISGGQAKRIAVARAILRDSPWLLMDEPTTHLDIQNELRLQHALQVLLREKTILMVAHRRGSIKDADQIIVLDEGNVIRIGKHEELLSDPGLYQKLILDGEQR
jgi:ATP-binding cassette subfamily C protein CydD